MKNLIIRALTGIIFVVVLISAIYIHPIFFLILFCIITGLTLWEFGGLVKHYENANLQRTVNVLGGVYLFIATFVYANGLTDGKIFLPYLLFIMLTMIADSTIRHRTRLIIGHLRSLPRFIVPAPSPY